MSKTIRKKPKLEYRFSVGGCDMSFCMHYDGDRRRCSLRKCFYDRANVMDEIVMIGKSRERPDYGMAYVNGLDEDEGSEWDG